MTTKAAKQQGDYRYLTRRGQVWWFDRKLPTHIQKALGRTHFRKTLGTGDIKEARKRRDLTNAEYQQFVLRVEHDGPSGGPIGELFWLAGEVRKSIQRALKTPGGDPEAHVEDEPEVLGAMEALDAFVERYQSRVPHEHIRTAYTASTATNDPTLGELIKKYLGEIKGELETQTVVEKERHLDEWTDWLGSKDLPLVTVVDQDRAYEWLQHLLSMDRSVTTKQKRLSSIASFFVWLMARGHCKVNPYAGLQVRSVTGRKGSQKQSRETWSDEDLKTLLKSFEDEHATAKLKTAKANAKNLKDLTVIGMYTGMRIDEICSLRAEDVVDEHGIPCLQITSGKTHAAVRLVPIHSALNPLIETLKEEAKKKGRDGYLLSGLIPGGPGAKRSWNIQKAFGRRKTALGFPQEKVFHSLRGTFLTKLKRAGAPVMLVKEVVGHHVNDLTFGHYSDEHLLETKRDAIELVRYEV